MKVMRLHAVSPGGFCHNVDPNRDGTRSIEPSPRNIVLDPELS